MPHTVTLRPQDLPLQSLCKSKSPRPPRCTSRSRWAQGSCKTSPGPKRPTRCAEWPAGCRRRAGLRVAGLRFLERTVGVDFGQDLRHHDGRPRQRANLSHLQRRRSAGSSWSTARRRPAWRESDDTLALQQGLPTGVPLIALPLALPSCKRCNGPIFWPSTPPWLVQPTPKAAAPSFTRQAPRASRRGGAKF